MFRTVFASLSVSGVSFAKGFFSLAASEEPRTEGPEIWVDPIDKLCMATVQDEDLEDSSEFMAEPLTDRVISFNQSNTGSRCHKPI